MSLEGEPLSIEAEALRGMYAAINRNDMPGTVLVFDPEIELIEPPEFPMGGVYRGLACVEEHLSKARASWAEGSCEPEQFLTAGDKVVVVVYVHVRLKHETEWREGRHADVFTFRNGRALEMRIFAEIEQGTGMGWGEGGRRILASLRPTVGLAFSTAFPYSCLVGFRASFGMCSLPAVQAGNINETRIPARSRS